MFKNTITYFTILMTLSSCGGTRYLSSGSLSKNDTYKIKSYYGCCGCEARYVTITSGKRIKEQIIYNFNCPYNGLPTKFIFNYNNSGKVTNCNRYVATIKDNYTIQVTKNEKMIFDILDKDTSLSHIENGNTLSFYGNIKGFRKPFENEKPHSFPFVKKGLKLPIR